MTNKKDKDTKTIVYHEITNKHVSLKHVYVLIKQAY